MKLAKVTGTVVVSRKDDNLPGERLLIVRNLDRAMQPQAGEFIVMDTVDAGEGDIVLYSTGSSARMTKTMWEKCVDGTIVGIVQHVTRGDQTVYRT